MKPDDVDIIEKTTPFDGYFQVDRYRLKHRLFEGGWSGEMTREVFERGHIAAVLPYDPKTDKIVLIEQCRPGAFAALSSPWFDDDASPWLLECVAGVIDAGETPESVARREMVEEAGCEVLDLAPIYHLLASPGGSSESIFCYCARIDASGAGGVHGLDHEHENIRVLPMDADNALKLLAEGRIINAATIICLQWFAQNRQSLRQKWSPSP
jgi:ADP-ribose pyrophosphatase